MQFLSSSEHSRHLGVNWKATKFSVGTEVMVPFVLTQWTSCSVTAPSPLRLGSKFLLLGRTTCWWATHAVTYSQGDPLAWTNQRTGFPALTNGRAPTLVTGTGSQVGTWLLATNHQQCLQNQNVFKLHVLVLTLFAVNIQVTLPPFRI